MAIVFIAVKFNIYPRAKSNPALLKEPGYTQLLFNVETGVTAPCSTQFYKEMKNLFVFAIVAVALTIFNGCQKSDEQVLIDEVQPQAVVKPDVYVENGYLAFKNINAVDSVIQLLSKMSTAEKESWEQQIGLKSARSDFDALFDEYDKLESFNEFLAFKERNKEKLKFNEMDEDDCSIDYPFATKYFVPVLNTKGLYKVGSSIVKYTEDNQIIVLDGDVNKLNNLDKYANDEMVVNMRKLKSYVTTVYDNFENDNNTNGPGYWFQSSSGKRRLRNQLSRDNYLYYSGSTPTSGWKIIFYQQGKKKNWRGKWKSYRTIYGVENVSIKVGNFPTYSYHTYTPSYTGDVYDSTREFASDHQVGTSALFYYYPTVIFSCDTYSRGVGTWYDLDH